MLKLGGGPTSGDMLGGLGDIFGMPQTQAYVPPQEVWLPAQKGKGLEIMGTFARKNNVINMELTFTNKAMQPMQGFAIQFNKNRFASNFLFLNCFLKCCLIFVHQL